MYIQHEILHLRGSSLFKRKGKPVNSAPGSSVCFPKSITYNSLILHICCATLYHFLNICSNETRSFQHLAYSLRSLHATRNQFMVLIYTFIYIASDMKTSSYNFTNISYSKLHYIPIIVSLQSNKEPDCTPRKPSSAWLRGLHWSIPG